MLKQLQYTGFAIPMFSTSSCDHDWLKTGNNLAANYVNRDNYILKRPWNEIL